MNKRFCDRCGNEIVETKRTVFQVFCDAVEQLVVNFGGKHRIKYIVQIIDSDDPKIPRPIADLCEQCEQDLTAFMNYTPKAKDGNDCSVIVLDEKTMKPSERREKEDKNDQSEVFMSKLTINRIIENGVCEKSAVLEVADRFGNKNEYDITDSDSIQVMLSHYDEDVPWTIDEAIVHAEEAAAQLQEEAPGWVRDGWQEHFKNLSPEDEAEMKKDREKRYSECKKLAADQSQLASWLRELKELKKKIVESSSQ